VRGKIYIFHSPVCNIYGQSTKIVNDAAMKKLIGVFVCSGDHSVVSVTRDPTRLQVLLHSGRHLGHWVHFRRDGKYSTTL
jgi:hypothetical protein